MTTVTTTEFATGTVGEAMTPGILTCLPVTPLRDVARLMARHRVHAIVVFASGDRIHPWGVVTDADVIRAIQTHSNAGSIATSPVVTVTTELSLGHAAALMDENRATHLVVISDEGVPVGVISTLDVLRALAAEGDVG